MSRLTFEGDKASGVAHPSLMRRPAPSLANKFARLFWRIVWTLFYRPSPLPFHGWRRGLLRCFGAKVGPGAHPYPAARIWAPWNLVMGEGSCLANEADCYNVDQVLIGDRAIVSQKAYLCTASHDIRDDGFALTSGPIEIAPRAWIAAGAFVGPGVKVGEGAVIAAYAVVTRSVAAQMVVAGNPAQTVGRRDGTEPLG